MRNVVRQGGSVKVFVIVGVVLTLIALSALYGLKSVSQNDQTPPMSLPDQSETSGDNTNSDNTDKTSSNSTSDKENQDDTKKEDSQQAVNEDDTTSDVSSNHNQSTGSGSTDIVQDSSTSSGALPQAGPTETFAAGVFALIAAGVVAYVRSLRHV